MFNVIRKQEAPKCLSRKIYNDPTVVNVLEEIFHSKCYLCESDNLQAPEIEHFIPHEDDDYLKYDWLNLFYSCARCNSIKSNSHLNLLDCTHPFVDVFSEVVHIMPSIPSQDVIIKAYQDNPSQETINTVALLEKCFNSENTALRGITRDNLLELLFTYYELFLEQRKVLLNKSSNPIKVTEAILNLAQMCKSSYPFSAFWKWHLLLDKNLQRRHSSIIEII